MTQTSSNKRIEWVDVAKFICAFFVIVSHLETNTKHLGRFFEPFYLNGFLFLSGYTFRYRPSFPEFLKRKAKQLLIPWLFFGLLVVISGSVYSSDPMAHSGLLTDLMWFLVQIREKNDAMWFLSALFTAYIPFYFFVRSYLKKKSNGRTFLYLAVLLILFLLELLYERVFPKDFFFWQTNTLPWHIEYLPTAVFFMFSGYVFREKIEKHFPEKEPVLFLLLLAVYCVLVYSDRVKSIYNSSLFLFITYNGLKQILGVAVLIFGVRMLKPNPVVLYMGQNTLIYFGIAHYVNFILQFLIKTVASSFYATVLSNELYSMIFSIVLATTTSLLLIIPSGIINRYFPFILGRF